MSRRRRLNPSKSRLKPTYNGIVAAYEHAGMQRDISMGGGTASVWTDSAIGTRPNGVASGAGPDWTGLALTMVTPSSLPPTFDGVDDIVGTGQAVNAGLPTMLNVSYQEYGTHSVPLEIDQGAVECWVKVVATSAQQVMVAYHYLNGIATQSGKFKYLHNSGGVTFVDSGVSVDTNWHHLLLNFDHGGTADFWIDGEKKVAAGAFTSTLSAGRSWYIGDYYYSNNPYEGLIDTVRIYNRNLEDSEILRNYWSGLALHS